MTVSLCPASPNASKNQRLFPERGVGATVFQVKVRLFKQDDGSVSLGVQSRLQAVHDDEEPGKRSLAWARSSFYRLRLLFWAPSERDPNIWDYGPLIFDNSHSIGAAHERAERRGKRPTTKVGASALSCLGSQG